MSPTREGCTLQAGGARVAGRPEARRGHGGRGDRRAIRRPVAALLLAATMLATIVVPSPARAEERARSRPVRNPGIAFLLSALLPGAGQLYNGDRRGYIYLGAEAAAWFTRISYRNAGETKEDQYEAFARRHWDFERWVAGRGQAGCAWTEDDSLALATYRAENLQQYYEAIGKKPQYRCGWDDFEQLPDPGSEQSMTPNQAAYREMRISSNDYLERARMAGAVLMINRLVSGFDAFRTARVRREGRAATLRLESGFGGTGPEPRAEIRLVKVLP